jgi:hypothetical protein
LLVKIKAVIEEAEHAESLLDIGNVKKLRGLQINRVPIILEGGEWE